MTTITIDRALLEQILNDVCGAKLCEVNSMSSRAEVRRLMGSAANAIRAALAAPATAPEPVATVAEVHMSRYTLEWTNGPLPEGTKLYAAPQAQPERKPMTVDEARIALGLEKPPPLCVMLDVRAVEAFHGIKDKP